MANILWIDKKYYHKDIPNLIFNKRLEKVPSFLLEKIRNTEEEVDINFLEEALEEVGINLIEIYEEIDNILMEKNKRTA